jgi:hypothetical protein
MLNLNYLILLKLKINKYKSNKLSQLILHIITPYGRILLCIKHRVNI